MDRAVKTLLIASALVVALLGAGVAAGWSLETPEVDPRAWLAGDDEQSGPLAETSDRGQLAEALAVPPPEQVSEMVDEAQAVEGSSPADDSGAFVIRRILPIEGPIRYGEWHWDDEGVPDGPLVVTVDLEARVLSVFRAGYEIGASAVLLGTDQHPTPTGVFPILTKERHNVSEKYGNAPMPWTLRLTWDGVAIHGGSTVELGYASHGCIGAPDAFVSRLYAIAQKGDRVIITDGRTASMGDRII